MGLRCSSGGHCWSWLVLVVLVIITVVTSASPSESASLQTLDDLLTSKVRRKFCVKTGRICGFRRARLRCCGRNKCVKFIRKGKRKFTKFKKIFRCINPSPSPSPSNSPCPGPDPCVSFWNEGAPVNTLAELAEGTAQCSPQAFFFVNRVIAGAPLCTVTCPGESRCPVLISTDLVLQVGLPWIPDCIASVLQLGFKEVITVGPCEELDLTDELLMLPITQSMRDASSACSTAELKFFFYDLEEQDVQSAIANACN